MKLLQLAKIARNGGMGPDQIAELLAAAGIDLQMAPVERADGPLAFRELAIAAGKPGGKLVAMRGQLKNGDAVEALLVVVPSPITRIGA